MVNTYEPRSEALQLLLSKASSGDCATAVIPDLQRPYVWQPVLTMPIPPRGSIKCYRVEKHARDLYPWGQNRFVCTVTFSLSRDTHHPPTAHSIQIGRSALAAVRWLLARTKPGR